jgi:hypothetical protein
VIDGPPSGEYVRRHWRTLIPYLIAAALYIGLGVWEPRFLLSWAEGILFLFFVVWAVPVVWRRIRRR